MPRSLIGVLYFCTLFSCNEKDVGDARKTAHVYLAGPLVNCVAVCGALVLYFCGVLDHHTIHIVTSINLMMLAVDLFPFGPTDGARAWDAFYRSVETTERLSFLE